MTHKVRGSSIKIREKKGKTFIMYCDCIPKPKRDKDYPDYCSECGGLYRGD